MIEYQQVMNTPVYTSEIAMTFDQTTVDLDTRVFLDGVDPASCGYRIRCHDQYGALPEILILEDEDNSATLESVRHSACKLSAIARIRDEIARTRPGINFGPEGTRQEVDRILDGYRKLRILAHKL
jgi:hypothetical protein